MEGILLLIVIGAVAGWLASFIIPNGFGLIGTIIVGIIGGVLAGHFLGGVLSITSNPLVNSIIVGFVGAVILLFILRLVKAA
ncbi:GlsB/YeaQ/YmgE family stress response membrane protein [Moraxella sp.]|uniref:GlsB/YeaQ/YmgE family stress response membrane protein n=1 Tax=Moraxella sp. TaxID=479 RepID=UPI0026111922|nr:GlsB/YeaQ/YmgE family stress response membrane protein [Moraxella sp.]MCP3897566.1 GlsB/YeaQ/YmgE family stress response membrane protein [Moraxella sp.]